MTTLRPDSTTCLSIDVRRALVLIAKITPPHTDELGFLHAVTADELADNFLRELIQERHPKVFEHLQQVDKMKAEFIKREEKKNAELVRQKRVS